MSVCTLNAPYLTNIRSALVICTRIAFSPELVSQVTLMSASAQQHQPSFNATTATNDSNTGNEDHQRIESLLQTIKCNSPIRPKVELNHCDLSDVDLSSANLHGANLYDARFTNSILSSANLGNANLSEAFLNSVESSQC